MTNGLSIPIELEHRMRDHLTALYGAEQSAGVWSHLNTILADFHRRRPDLAAVSASESLTERDVVLITYGDQFQEPGVPTFRTLHQVLTETLERVVSAVHILPFFPYSSDDGFSVVDYAQVNPEFGTWSDVERLGNEYRLMFDAVINHISRESVWFQRFLSGDPEYADWFISFEPDIARDWVSQVFRPRALPLLTPVRTVSGKKLVWTTFSDDQIDLNFAHPAVLLGVIEVLLSYVEKGAQIIRLDAIAYLWKKIGTSCLHLEETHRVVKLLRCALDAVAPAVLIITETNVPHEENISYFGQPLPGDGGTDEAQLVYQFPLAPLIMHSILTGDATVIADWAAGLETPSSRATFFNFTASHDGIGVMPARGLLTEAEVQGLVDTTLAHGGLVSHKANADGSRSVYELNISFFDAVSNPAAGEPQQLQVRRFMVSQAIMLALGGLPGIYVHSLLGSQSWHDGVAQTGRNRSINRQKFDREVLERALSDPAQLQHQVLAAYKRLLRARTSDPAFHPYGGQQVLMLDARVLALIRISPEGDSRVLCLHNVSDEECRVMLSPADLGLEPGSWSDLLTGEAVEVGGDGVALILRPYQVCWLSV